MLSQTLIEVYKFANVLHGSQWLTRFSIKYILQTLAGGRPGDNLVSLSGEKAQAVVEKSHLQLKPRPLTKKGKTHCLNSGCFMFSEFEMYGTVDACNLPQQCYH